MKEKILVGVGIIILFALCAYSVEAKDGLKQLKQIRITALDTAKGYEKEYVAPDENLDDIFGQKLDTLFGTWYIKNFFLPRERDSLTASSGIGLLPDSVYIDRLQNIEAIIDLSYNKVVKNFINLYTNKRREQVEVMLGLSAFYFPIFEEILDKNDLPLELKYLPIIESALNPRARSWAGATGLWQFMYGTGKEMKLEISSYVDERRDAVRASEAAAKYLKQLYSVYKNWQLVIAAYNCGPGNVNKAIRRSGGKRNYWEIYYRLPRETRGYVPAFIAATYTMEYYKTHNLVPLYPEIPLITDTIMVSELLHLSQIAANIDISIEGLRELNPMYRTDVIPAKNNKPYPLRLPQELLADFIDNESEIFNHNRENHFPNNTLIQPSSRTSAHYAPVDIKGKEKVYYKVKSGDNVGFIASWFHVRASDLRYWNNINRNLIRVGQRLVIYVPKGEKEKYEKVDAMSFDAKQWSIGKSPNSAKVKKAPQPIDPDYIYYTVRRGDNLWEIAKKFSNISNKDIMLLNNITNDKGLFAGQKLKIRKKI